VFIKFANADSINVEWNATTAITPSLHIHLPFDRSPPREIAIGQSNQFHFIVSTLINGDDLLNMFGKASGQLPRHFLEVVFCQTINAMVALQVNGIVHGDIKPENLMWDTTEQLVKVIDFEHSVKEGEIQEGGTKEYQAPEGTQRTPAHYSRDVYSVGVSFLTLWCGEKPLFVREELINWPSELGGDRGLLLSAMVQWNPEDRPAPEAICQLLASASH
jgi:serine/threonine protein kinase